MKILYTSKCIYPAHPFQDGGRWQFPGVGAFECYMKYMIKDLRTVVWQEGNPDWANKGPPIASDYNCPNDVPFFEEGEGRSSSNYEDHAWKKLKLANEQEIYEIKSEVTRKEIKASKKSLLKMLSFRKIASSSCSRASKE
ncbi:inactive beta-amylase 4, chloroplastic isoform X2 [Tanacetum coccineum]